MRHSNRAKGALPILLTLAVLCFAGCYSQSPATSADISTISTGDVLTSPAPPGTSSRAARPPGSGAVLSHDSVRVPSDTWIATWYSGDEFVANPLETSPLPGPYLDLTWTAPFPDIPEKDQPHRVSLTRKVSLKGGAYRFYTWAEGSVRLWVNKRLIIAHDAASKDRPLLGNIWLDRAGPVLMEIAYQAKGPGGRLRVYWERIEWFSGWRGEYYSNRYLSGEPTFVRNDPTLCFNWGTDAPAINLPEDDFSVRWSRSVTLSTGHYRFLVAADEGVRLYIDDLLIVNAWQGIASETVQQEIMLEKGSHTLMVEYFDRQGEAHIALKWERIGP